MISIADLKPSFLQKLEASLFDFEFRSEFLKAIADFLRDTPADDGSYSDDIYSAAVQLTHARAWSVISTQSLAQAVQFVPLPAVGVFSEGLPTEFSRSFILQYHALRSEVTTGWSYGRIPTVAMTDVQTSMLASFGLLPLDTCSLDPFPQHITREQLDEMLAEIERRKSKALEAGALAESEERMVLHLLQRS
jgi:hypothetical protein